MSKGDEKFTKQWIYNNDNFTGKGNILQLLTTHIK